MRARNRHCNPINGGATYAFDTRFNKDGYTDGSAVGTWTDRGNNTATESVSANRPLWQNDATNNINGNPVVQFDGSNDTLQTASTVTVTALSCIAVCYRPWTTGKYSPIFTTGYGASAGAGMLSSGGQVQDWQNKDFFLVGDGYLTPRAPRAIGSYGAIADNSPQIVAGILSANLARSYLAGVTMSTRVESTGSVPSITAAVFIGGFAPTNDFGNFSFGQVSYWRNIELSASLRRRFEHAAGYSFKIACS